MPTFSRHLYLKALESDQSDGDFVAECLEGIARNSTDTDRTVKIVNANLKRIGNSQKEQETLASVFTDLKDYQRAYEILKPLLKETEFDESLAWMEISCLLNIEGLTGETSALVENYRSGLFDKYCENEPNGLYAHKRQKFDGIRYGTALMSLGKALYEQGIYEKAAKMFNLAENWYPSARYQLSAFYSSELVPEKPQWAGEAFACFNGNGFEKCGASQLIEEIRATDSNDKKIRLIKKLAAEFRTSETLKFLLAYMQEYKIHARAAYELGAGVKGTEERFPVEAELRNAVASFGTDALPELTKLYDSLPDNSLKWKNGFPRETACHTNRETACYYDATRALMPSLVARILKDAKPSKDMPTHIDLAILGARSWLEKKFLSLCKIDLFNSRNDHGPLFVAVKYILSNYESFEWMLEPLVEMSESAACERLLKDDIRQVLNEILQGHQDIIEYTRSLIYTNNELNFK